MSYKESSIRQVGERVEISGMCNAIQYYFFIGDVIKDTDVILNFTSIVFDDIDGDSFVSFREGCVRNNID